MAADRVRRGSIRRTGYFGRLMGKLRSLMRQVIYCLHKQQDGCVAPGPHQHIAERFDLESEPGQGGRSPTTSGTTVCLSIYHEFLVQPVYFIIPGHPE